MLTTRLEIINQLGLHARAASVFVKTASAFSAEITVSNPEKTASGKSIMQMMMLQASCGTFVDISVEGDDEVEAMNAITELINNRFGEDQ